MAKRNKMTDAWSLSFGRQTKETIKEAEAVIKRCGLDEAYVSYENFWDHNERYYFRKTLLITNVAGALELMQEGYKPGPLIYYGKTIKYKSRKEVKEVKEKIKKEVYTPHKRTIKL